MHKPEHPAARCFGLPRIARGGRRQDSNWHDRFCSWPSSPHTFPVYRALADCGRRVPRRAAAMPADAMGPWTLRAGGVNDMGMQLLKDRV